MAILGFSKRARRSRARHIDKPGMIGTVIQTHHLALGGWRQEELRAASATYIVRVKSWAVVAHAFNPSSLEAEAGGSL